MIAFLNRKANMTLEDIESLETVCTNCEGSGRRVISFGKRKSEVACTCSNGKAISDIGQKLLDFLNKYQNIDDKIDRIVDHAIDHHYDCSHGS